MNQPTYQILFYLLVFFHHVFIILTILTPFYVTFNEPFWIWVPINIWITHLMFSPVLVCPATIWENRLRRRLNKPEIKTFFLHYYIKPIKKLLIEWVVK
jgi:membrane protein implicated in regulation of membrane protease activity